MSNPPNTPTPTSGSTPANGPLAPYTPPPIDDEFVRTREHELTRREHLLVTALLPCSLLLYATNTAMVWLLPSTEYSLFGPESLVCYALATFLLVVWSYVKWRYVWSVRRAHHLTFYLKRAIEVVAALALLVMGCYLFGFQYYTKADLTYERKLSLSPRSVEILKALPEGGRIDIYMPFSESGLNRMSEADRLGLVRERRMISRVCKDIEEDAPQYTKASVKFTPININEEPDKATDLAMKLQMPPGPNGQPALPTGTAENVFVVYTEPPRAGAGPRAAPTYYYIAKNKMFQRALFTKKGQSQGLAFVGESRILSTIDTLRINKRTVCYYIDNHSRGTTPIPEHTNAANSLLNSNNLSGLPLNLLVAEKVPDDAQFVMLWNIQTPLTEAECDKLYKYVLGGGSMLVCIDPQGESGSASGLAPFLDHFGLSVHQERIINTISNNRSLAPLTFGFMEDVYLQKELPENYGWLQQMAQSFQPGTNPIYLRGACYLEPPRAISEPALTQQHASFYDMLTSDSTPTPEGAREVIGTAIRPGEKEGPAGPYILGGVVQMSMAYPAGKEPVDALTKKKILAKDHHLFIVTDSDWVFGNDNMGNHANQMYLDSILQKLTGSDRVWETNDTATNFIYQNPHSLLVAFFTGILPALILAIAGYLYLSARRQMPAEVVSGR